ncbi:HNH endonuclease [Arthrobacter psychrochitiniphilus]|uniref:HNH nuclease domain-containing protein n=1 Tax=Arthrobacter psychrochitiniphilus TaxID=291045 RepID=A0A2V3DPR5_9MICC|nr:HNH endonuclease [Arthrobacter psychrochitiniphilus]NYG18257.1 hypothetical protein [Arthrobacter psychrochitiniphilus]PXA64950.1 hypothetical protein CVS29_12210 [Arthrobacter psychrochitiniphilus]
MAVPEWFDERGGMGRFRASDPAQLGSVAAPAAGTVAAPAAGPGAAPTNATELSPGAGPGAAPTNAPESSRGAIGLVHWGMDTLQRCGEFFDPVVLANLDAALAHELANRASSRAADAAQELELAICESRPAQALAHFAQQQSSSKATAAKAQGRAAEATVVITSLGGAATDLGFDPAIVDGVSSASLVDAISVLEEAKNALSAVQAQAQALFVAGQRLEQARSGVPQERLGRGIIQQVALARHESPHRGRQLAELSEVLVREMPHTMNALVQGNINEYRATIVARETAFLSFEDRAKVDQMICGDADAVALLGTRELAASSRKAAYGLDPQAFLKRHEKAVGDRYVSLCPAPDGMTFLTALIPLKQGIRILTTLTKVADSAKASGNERSKGQIMADALMHRLIQHAPCDEGAGTLSDHRGVPEEGAPTEGASTVGVPSQAVAAEGTTAAGVSGAGHAAGTSWTTGSQPSAGGGSMCTTVSEPDIALELVMTDRALFEGANDPAVLVGYDPIPAPLARSMVLGDGGGFSPQVWLKRLFTHPKSNALMAMDSRSRLFPEGMKEFIRLQDQRCQTPYCDAPIRQYDHFKAYAAGGLTTIENGKGLCVDCNQQKEAPGWSFERGAGPEHGLPTTEIRTPTGHRYVSTAPPLPGGTQGKPSRRSNGKW